MNRKLIALAVAGAFLAPAAALADTANVTIYGTLTVDFENVKADGTTGTTSLPAGVTSVPGLATSDLPGRNRVTSNGNSTNVGIRGTESLGGGLNAVFQCESAIGIDGQASTLCGRNSNLGLAGNFGTVFLGRWDSPYKITFIQAADNFSALITFASAYGIIGGNSVAGSANTFTTGRESFDRRTQNSVNYFSPNWGGFFFRLQYGANEERGTGTTAATAGANPYLWSGSLNFAQGPFYVGYGYERHEDFGGKDTKDTGHRLTGKFTFGTTTITALYERIKWEDNLATGFTGGVGIKGLRSATADEAELDAWYLGVAHRMGPHTFKVSYAADRGLEFDGDEVSDSKARQWSLAYAYALSKRTELFAVASRLRNEKHSANRFNGQQEGVLSGAAPFTPGLGADSRAIGVGIKHSF